MEKIATDMGAYCIERVEKKNEEKKMCKHFTLFAS